jgi:DNA-binding PadR family transcriptional regulator
MSRPVDLVQGTLDMLLLKILALGPMNGFAVSQRLKQVSGDVLQVSDGSLYPALHKLEQEGWITAEWKTSEYGRRVGSELLVTREWPRSISGSNLRQ